MTRAGCRGALCLVLLVVCATARAAPFDTYELVMWQERTPVQTAALARLGFTGTKLRATGGQIHPDELAAHRASGMPWYLENIATDFYSAYHRSVPNRPVTSLFDAAKALHRRSPADAGAFIRQPGLSDPGWLAGIQSRLRTLVHGQAAYRPLFYNLADEAGIADLAAAWDFDRAPASLAAMQGWLRTQYATLAALNREWGTSFADWNKVDPESTDAALRRADGNYAAWADFKAWMDVAFTRAVRAGTDAIHQADPQALSGLEGAQLPGWGGYDYGLLAAAVDVMEIYDFGGSLDLATAFNPGLVALRTSSEAGPRDAHAAWRHLLHGGRGTIVWDEAGDVVLPDGSPGPRGKSLAVLIADLRSVAPAIIASRPSFDPVAVLISQASFRTTWLLDRRQDGPGWAGRNAAREYEDNAWRAARRQVLYRLGELGVQPHLLSSPMLEAGALRDPALRVLILPHAIALSGREAGEITSFAHRGGTVLADGEPGLFDQHSRRLAAPALIGIAKVPEAMLLGDGSDDPATLDALAVLLARAGAAPRLVLTGPDQRRATGIDARWHARGTGMILSLQTQAPWSAARRIRLHLSAPARVAGRSTRDAAVNLDPIRPTILLLEH